MRGNYWAGETFADLADAQARAETWCRDIAGQRVHGSTRAHPAEVFAEHEAPVLLPAPATPYEVPLYAVVTVHRDHHVQLGKALYSMPEAYLGQQICARADAELAKFYHRGQLIKTHPRQRPGGRSTDPADLPAEKTAYAMRDLNRLVATATGHGPNVGIYAERLLDDKLPWTRMRQVYRLLSLAKRYGPVPVDTACGRALELDVVAVGKIAAMLEQASENTPAPRPRAVSATVSTRFARDPGEYKPKRVKPYWMKVIDGGPADTGHEDGDR